MALIQLNPVCSAHSEQKLDSTKNKIIFPCYLVCIELPVFSYEVFFIFLDSLISAILMCRAAGRQPSVGFLKAPGAQGPAWVPPMVYGAVGSLWGQLWVSCAKEGSGHCCLLILALGTQSWGRRAEKALLRQHHQVQGRAQPAAVFLCHHLHTSLLAGIWQCHSKTSYLLALKRRNMVRSSMEVAHSLFNASVWF